jgi:methylenetetrahydrofolate reductase (NADPH)
LHFSFEFFPPKNPEMEEKLWVSLQKLAHFQPDFVSVTYGAGGTTRERTHQTVKRIHDETSLKPAAHLTCVGASKTQVDEVAKEYWDAGIRHIVALRGDPAQGTKNYIPHENGYAYAVDLIKGLRKAHDFDISVAAFPEKHPESLSFEQDMDILKRKIDAGASRAITQYFFDTDLYLTLLERVRKAGITIPILPGLIPISHFGQLQKFSAMCGASLPQWLVEKFEKLDSDPAARDCAAIELVTKQGKALQAEGIDHFHFYTLNRADLTAAICKNLGA